MDEINNELNNFHNFEYKKDIYRFNNYNKKINTSYNCNSENLKKSTNIESKLNNIIFDNSETKENKLYKFFKNPEKPLFQIHGIKLEDIENRIIYITNKLVNISFSLEDIDIDNRNKFLENIKNIGEESNKFSHELSKLLKFEFEKKCNPLDKNENVKRILSSCFNQSLIVVESPKNNKFKRYFFEFL